MATYYIPTDYSGGTILVNEGDVFIFESGAATDVKFESATGTPTNFQIEFNESNANGITVDVQNDLSPDIAIADGVSLDNTFLKTQNADDVNLTIGNDVTLHKYEGSDNGTDTVTIGDNFVTNNDFKTGSGDDYVVIGENATAPKFDLQGGNDTIVTADPNATITNTEIILEPDGTVTGTGGDDIMGVGYSDTETDEIDENDNIIIGLGGGDTIAGGAGADIIYGDYTPDQTAVPDPASGADLLSFDIQNTNISGGSVTYKIDAVSDKSLANDLTVTDGATNPITSLKIEKLGGGDNEVDVVRIDLSTFDDDFVLTFTEQETEDLIYMIGIESETDNGDGTFTYTYVGSDDAVHSVTVTPGNATVSGFYAEAASGTNDDIIDGGAGDDTIYADGGDDTVTGGAGADVIYGGAGADSLDGGDDADRFIIGDGFGADTITGGEGGTDEDVIDLSGLSGSVTVTYTGDEAGWITDGTDTLNFSGIERLILTDNADVVDATATTSGIDVTAGDGNDTITGGTGADTLSGGAGADSLVGGLGTDNVTGGAGDDTIDGGADADTLDGGSGNDSILGGDGNDSIDGGRDNDTIFGGDGDDTLSGGESVAELENRTSFKWSDIPDPDDGGQIDLGDAITTGSQVVGGTTVSYTLPSGLGSYDPSTVYTADIDAGGSSVDPNSALSLDYMDAVATLDFSTAVENLEFRINDFEGNSELLEVRAYDADNNPLTIVASPGSTITVTDTDGDGFSEFKGSGASGDNNPLNSILFQIAGPVARIELDHSSPGNGSLTVTDLWFDDPAITDTGGLGGDDLIDGGAGNDVIDGLDGADTLSGGTGADTLTGGAGADLMDGGGDADSFVIEDGFGADTIIGGETGIDDDQIDLSAMTTAATLTYTGDEAGTITDGTDAISFSAIERVVLTDQNDSVDASATTQGVDVDGGAGNDSIRGGAGDDSLTGGAGLDTLTGGDGADTLDGGDDADNLSGGAGADSLVGGLGDDTLSGGDGDDILDAGDGNDQIFSNNGNDTVYAGDGNDTVHASLGADLVYGGAGDDSLTGGGFSSTGHDTLYGEEGNDTLSGGNGNDVLDGGDGADSILGWADDDLIRGGAGADTIDGGTGNDTLSYEGSSSAVSVDLSANSVSGGDATGDVISNMENVIGSDFDDSLTGDANANRLEGGAGADTLDGGTGNDTLDGGAGDDTLTGGAGDDTFIVSEGHDAITDFGTGESGASGDGNATNNDRIALGDYYDSLDELKADQADDGILNHSNTVDDEGKAVDYSDNAQFGAGSLTVQGATAQSYSYDNTGIVCFTSGTLIRTPRGHVPIDDLRAGDLVTTMDNGPQRIVWIGRRHLGHAELLENEKLRPVLIREGVLGVGRDMLVSRQHGMLIGRDSLARAIHLAETMPGIRVAHGRRQVTYIHLMFEAHQIIFAEGVPSESFYPGPMGLKMMGGAARDELMTLFPELARCASRDDVAGCYGALAREFLTKKALPLRNAA